MIMMTKNKIAAPRNRALIKYFPSIKKRYSIVLEG